LLRRLTGNAAEAEDLTQETFLAAYRSLHAWRGEGAFGTWLCGIAFRCYANARRRSAAHATEPLEDESLPAGPAADLR
jgi:RNA polymerase sigma-70 factor (ECF subfamily)